MVAWLIGDIVARMYRVQVADSRVAVLRRWDAGYGSGAIGLVRRGGHALEALAGTPIPTLCLIAADSLGTEAGVPSRVMSLVSGEVGLTLFGFERWLRELAATLAAIQVSDVGAERYESWVFHAAGVG